MLDCIGMQRGWGWRGSDGRSGGGGRLVVGCLEGEHAGVEVYLEGVGIGMVIGGRGC